MPVDLTSRREEAAAFDVRRVHPNLRVGTASDRYAGWIGQIYPKSYASHVTTNKRTLGGRSFQEGKVPVASVADYFAHFGVLEIDYTFYRPLLEEDGAPSSNYFTLQKYLDHAPADAAFLLKAPQMYFARTLRRGGTFVDNPDFLDAGGYLERFHQPATELLGDRLGGVLFQQEYQRVADSPSPEANVEALDPFFAQLPEGVQTHLELRSEHLLKPVYFDWLAERGLGFVFSHWTWLPALRAQWKLCGERFTAADGTAVARLLTPRDVKYADAYAAAFPFDKPTPELSDTKQARDMVLDAAALTFQAEQQGALLNLVCNNRAWGNAPDLARTIAKRVLDEMEKRAAGD